MKVKKVTLLAVMSMLLSFSVVGHANEPYLYTNTWVDFSGNYAAVSVLNETGGTLGISFEWEIRSSSDPDSGTLKCSGEICDDAVIDGDTLDDLIDLADSPCSDSPAPASGDYLHVKVFECSSCTVDVCTGTKDSHIRAKAQLSW